MIVVELAVATLIGALFGAGAVHGVVRWRATRVPLLRVKYRRVSGRDMRRLASAFDIRHRRDSYVLDEPVVGWSGEGAPPPVRMTYVRGPVRNQDTGHG